MVTVVEVDPKAPFSIATTTDEQGRVLLSDRSILSLIRTL